jgi:hypothetical protein
MRMFLEVVKADLVNMVIGTDGPYYSHIDHPSIKPFGYFLGGFHDKWFWNRSDLTKASVEELLTVYRLVKESWSDKG